MKSIFKIISLTAVLVIINASILYAQPRLEYGEPLKTYVSGSGLDIISYSEGWNTNEKLEEVYNELLNNFHSEELNYLDAIYIYPDSPEGTSGYYYEASTIDHEGKYTYGKEGYIEVFNADEYYDISQMAWVLAHEYGHHFTFYYLVTAENKYYSQWYDTGYAKIREFDKYDSINYDNNNIESYVHEWDVTEIAAEDYVQLFGSPLAKKSIDYKDVSERLKENISDYYYLDNSYNLLPQENLSLPLASDVEGLYNYWLNLAGYTAAQPSLVNKPRPYIVDSKTVYFEGNKKYALTWDEVQDNKDYEYTVVMYPIGMSSFPIPVKTVKTGEEMLAYIGSDVKKDKDGETYGILEMFEGEYEIRLFIKDMNNFMFTSQTLYYDFTNEISNYDDNIIKYTKSESIIMESNKEILDYSRVYFQPLYIPLLSQESLINNKTVIKIATDKKEKPNAKKIIEKNVAILKNNEISKYRPDEKRIHKGDQKKIIRIAEIAVYNRIFDSTKIRPD